MHLKTRRLTIEDEPIFHALINSVEENLECKEYWEHINDDERKLLITNPDIIMLGVFDKDILVATAGLSCYSGHITDVAARLGISDAVGVIGRVMTLPEYRGNGLASALIKDIISESSILRLGTVISYVHPSNIESCKMFISNGFDVQDCAFMENDSPRYIYIRKVG